MEVYNFQEDKVRLVIEEKHESLSMLNTAVGLDPSICIYVHV